ERERRDRGHHGGLERHTGTLLRSDRRVAGDHTFGNAARRSRRHAAASELPRGGGGQALRYAMSLTRALSPARLPAKIPAIPRSCLAPPSNPYPFSYFEPAAHRDVPITGMRSIASRITGTQAGGTAPPPMSWSTMPSDRCAAAAITRPSSPTTTGRSGTA